MKIIDPKLKFKIPPTPLKIVEKIIQHHMAHPTWDIYDVHIYHKYTKGWNGIGYNYWIHINGNIYIGRGDENKGAHAGSIWNDKSLAIGYMGDIHEHKMTKEQIDAGIALNKYLINKWNLTPDDIIQHKDVSATLCAGRYFQLEDIKRGVRNNNMTWQQEIGLEALNKLFDRGYIDPIEAHKNNLENTWQTFVLVERVLQENDKLKERLSLLENKTKKIKEVL